MGAKIIEFQQGTRPQTADVFTGKVSIETLQNIWNDDTVTYSDEELIRIREWLYALSEVIITVSTQSSKTVKIISLNQEAHETTEGHTLYPREHRRAS